MPRILRNKKKLVLIVALLVSIATVGCVLHCNLYATTLVFFCVVGIFTLNEYVYAKMYEMQKPLSLFSGVRNVDYLLIGDFCDAKTHIPQGKSYVQISAPNRGYESCFEILRHAHSILKENGGTVVLTMGDAKGLTVFDIPFMHPVTMKIRRLKGLYFRSKFPLVFAPIASLQFLRGGGPSYMIAEEVCDELLSFCTDRGYALKCYHKKRSRFVT